LNRCSFSTEGCGLSFPCAKCRDVSNRAAHVLVRFESHRDHGWRFSSLVRTRYETKRDGDWQRDAA